VEGSKDTQMMRELKPLALGLAFNSSVEPDVEATPSRSNGTRRKSVASMEIFGGREADLESGSEESSSDDEEALLSLPSVLNKPRRLSVGVASQGNVGASQGNGGELRSSSTDDTSGGDTPVEDNVHCVEGNALEFTPIEEMLGSASPTRADESLETVSTPTSVSPKEILVPEVPHLVGNVEGDCPVPTRKIDNTTLCSQTRMLSKRRNPTEPNNCSKRTLRKDGKMDVLVSSQKKEVLRLLADEHEGIRGW
jgi:hypothetical protein